MASAGRHHGGMSRAILIAISLLLGAGNLWAASSTVSLESSTTVSKEGYIDFQWGGVPAAGVANLVIAVDPDFQQLIWDNALPRQSTVSVSGLADGKYFARVTVNNPSGAKVIHSNTVAFTVEHHSLVLAGFLFVVGAALFLVLARTVWVYSRDDTAGDVND